MGERRDQLRIEIRDDGVGFDPKAPASEGLGLIGMRERVAAAGGKLTLGNRSGGGFAISAWLPLRMRQRAAGDALGIAS